MEPAVGAGAETRFGCGGLVAVGSSTVGLRPPSGRPQRHPILIDAAQRSISPSSNGFESYLYHTATGVAARRIRPSVRRVCDPVGLGTAYARCSMNPSGNHHPADHRSSDRPQQREELLQLGHRRVGDVNQIIIVDGKALGQEIAINLP